MNENDNNISIPENKNELGEIKEQLKKQNKMLKAILILLIIFASILLIYVLHEMITESFFGRIIGIVSKLFGH